MPPRKAMSLPARSGTCSVGDRGRAGEPRVDVDDRGAAGLGLHHPLEPHRVALGHVRALDDDAVRVLQVLQEAGGAATAEGGPQTGNGGAVSNTGLVLDLDGAHRGEQLLDQVVLFVVQGGPAEARRCPGCGARGRPWSSWSCQVRARLATTSGRRSCRSRSRGRAAPTRCRTAGGRASPSARPGLLTSCSLAEPFGHSRPREIGESGSPSIWTTFSSLTKTRWPQPTAQ